MATIAKNKFDFSQLELVKDEKYLSLSILVDSIFDYRKIVELLECEFIAGNLLFYSFDFEKFSFYIKFRDAKNLDDFIDYLEVLSL